MNNNKTQTHFNRLIEKLQNILYNNPRSRHVVLTEDNIRSLYILYLSKIQECTMFKSHQCHLAIIYNRYEIVHMDVNTRFHLRPKEATFTTHAEVNAIKSLIKTFQSPKSQFGMFLIRFSKTAILNNSSPCFFCARFIKKHLPYFHSISFTNHDESVTTMIADDFRQHEFRHLSLRYSRLLT